MRHSAMLYTTSSNVRIIASNLHSRRSRIHAHIPDSKIGTLNRLSFECRKHLYLSFRHVLYQKPLSNCKHEKHPLKQYLRFRRYFMSSRHASRLPLHPSALPPSASAIFATSCDNILYTRSYTVRPELVVSRPETRSRLRTAPRPLRPHQPDRLRR